MSKHKPISGASKPRIFFDRKVRLDGHTRSLSMSKIIPESWAYVRMKIIKQKPNSVTVKIQKLIDVKQLARIEKVSYNSKPQP